jgi:hypothetical protein
MEWNAVASQLYIEPTLNDEGVDGSMAGVWSTDMKHDAYDG